VRYLSRLQWTTARESYKQQLHPWAFDRVSRASSQRKHPVYDFLFTYYSYRPAYLLRWSPGADVVLEDAREADLDWPLDYVHTKSGYVIPSSSFPEHRREYLRWAVRYLEATRDRPAAFNCFGLHEWAMLYHLETPRHSDIPLRISGDTIAAVIDGAELRCSHYDAYRFFTTRALPRNRTALSRESTLSNDQPGCIHVTMDLYRFAHKIAPWCPADIIADTFGLATAARELDMRASPYDLREFGFEPICIETPSGRAQYTKAQYDLKERSVPIRARLLEVYSTLLKSCQEP
jgi:hypothetical protein